MYQRHRGERPGESAAICCLWMDEFHQQEQDCADAQGFRACHERFVEKRVAQLAQAEPRRLAAIVALPTEWSGMNEADRRRDFARYVLAQAWELHQQPHNHGVDPASGKRVSFGLVRMANIDPLFDVALAMYAKARPRPACACICASITRSFPCWRAPASSGS